MLVAIAGATACRGPTTQMNSVQRAQWTVRLSELSAERAALRTREADLRAAIAQAQAQVAASRTELAAATARQEAVGRELAAELGVVRAMEEDGVANRARRAQLERERDEFAQLEASASARRAAHAAVLEADAALTAELERARAALEARRSEVAALVQHWNERAGAVGKAGDQLRAALATARELIGEPVEAPPKPPDPAAKPPASAGEKEAGGKDPGNKGPGNKAKKQP